MPQAEVRWTHEMQFVAKSQTGHALVLDTIPEVGGNNTGPTPMELLLMGLGGCTGMDVVYILVNKMKKSLTGLEVIVSGKRADDSPKIFTEIEVRYRLRSRGIDPKDSIRAMQLSVEKYCSVSAMLQKAAKITHSYELIDDLTGQTQNGILAHTEA